MTCVASIVMYIGVMGVSLRLMVIIQLKHLVPYNITTPFAAMDCGRGLGWNFDLLLPCLLIPNLAKQITYVLKRLCSKSFTVQEESR